MITGSESGIRETRAAQASEAIRIHQDALINSHKIELSRLKSERVTILDLAPDNSTSLRAVDRNFDPASFVQKIQQIDTAIIEQEFYLSVAQRNYNAWFNSEIPE